jgi:hypothetical protein
MFDFAEFSNPDLSPKAKAFVPPRVRSVNFDKNKDYEKESVHLSTEESGSTSAQGDTAEKIIPERVKRPKLVVEKIKKDEMEQQEEPNEKGLTVKTKPPKLYINPYQIYPMPYIYGYPAQYIYPPNYLLPDNFQYPNQYPFQIQYPNGLPIVQPPVGDQKLLNLNAPNLGATLPPGEEYQQEPMQSEESANLQESETLNLMMNEIDAISSSDTKPSPQIDIEFPFDHDLEKVSGEEGTQQTSGAEHQQQPQDVSSAPQEGNNAPQEINQMAPQIRMTSVIDPYTGIPYQVPAQITQPNISDPQLVQDKLQKSDLSVKGLVVQKSLNAKPHIPTIDHAPAPIIDPSGLSIEKPNVNKSLKLTWLPPGITIKDRENPEEVIQKSGISITKKEDLKLTQLVLETKEYPTEVKPQESTLPTPPSMFQTPPTMFQTPPTMFQTPPTMLQPPPTMFQDPTTSSKASEEVIKPPSMFPSSEVPTSPHMTFTSAEASSNTPVTPINQITIVPKLDTIDSYTDTSAADEEHILRTQQIYLDTIKSSEGEETLPFEEQETPSPPVSVEDQFADNPEAAVYYELLRQRREYASESSSDVYGQPAESDKPAFEEPPQPEETTNEPVIDFDIDDILGIV